MDRHAVDPTSLVFGLAFTVIGLMLLRGEPTVGTVWLGWTVPVVLLGLGLLIVLAVRPTRSRDGANDDLVDLDGRETDSPPPTEA